MFGCGARRSGRRAPRGAAACSVGVLAAGLWAGVPAAAQDAPQRVEVTATPASDTEQRRREPVAKTIYGRDELDKHGDTNVSDVLKRLPGINLSGGNPRLRGLGAGYTLILVNGEPAPPGFSLDNLSPGQVERIEVTKGPTAEYPAAAGTINVVLREPPRQRQRELRLNNSWQGGTPVGSAHGTWGDRLGEFSLVWPVSVFQWRNETPGRSSRLSWRDGLPRQWQQASVDEGWGGGLSTSPRLSWRLGEADTLNLSLYLQRNAFRNAGRVETTVLQGDPPPSLSDRYVSHGHWQALRLSPQWLHRSPAGWRLELRAQVQASGSRAVGHTEGYNPGAATPALVRDARSRWNERQRSTAGKLAWPIGEDHSLVLGWDAEARDRREQRSLLENGIDPMSAQEALPFDTRVTRQSVYLQDEWEINPQWAAYLGLRGEALRTESLAAGTLPAASSQRTLWSPVLHLRHKLTPGARDLLRFSAGRSFKPPELAQLVGRYALNTLYPKTEPNTELVPDRAGNPALRPEQVTTFDLALEKYLPGGGVLSAGVFHRQVDGLIRQRLDQTLLAETGVLRWVFRPANLAGARSTGLEFEVKGRADELLPAAWSPSKALNLRASLSVYRSAIDGLPGPNDRLDGQQPWQATLGFDHALGPVLAGVPVTIGASAAFTPGYVTQQTAEQRLQQAGLRNIDAFVLFSVSRSLQLRLSGSDLAPRATLNTTTVTSADHPDALSQQWRRRLRTVNASLVAKF